MNGSRYSLNAIIARSMLEVIVAMDRLIQQDQLYHQRAEALQRIITRRKQIPATDSDSVELLREDRER